MTDTPPASTPPPAQSKSHFWRELLETVLLTVIIFLVVRLALQNFKVDGDSMYPNLHNGEYILVNKLAYLFHSPQRGDIIVFQAVPALQPDRDFIKRVIALPGETVAVHSGSVFIDGHRLVESYIHVAPNYTFRAQTVPSDNYFVLGDNRINSYDSAKWPSTPWLQRKYIIGKAWVAYWPPSAFNLFRSPSYPSL